MVASIDLVHLTLLSLLACSTLSSAQDFLFNGFEHAAANLSLDGSAQITHDGVLQLTTDTRNVTGHAFFSSPVRMLRNQHGGSSKAVSFSTAFIFDIATGNGGGHGLAFFMAPSMVLPGDKVPGKYLGLLGPSTNGNFSNHVFAIEFDTVQNQDFNETNENHVGVDINSLVSNVSKPAAYYADASKKVDLDLESAQSIQAWIDYNVTTEVLNVTIAPLYMPRPPRPLISCTMDLSPIFRDNMYVGFSSSTGKKVTSLHYILAWSFRTDGIAQPIDLSRLPKVPQVAGPPWTTIVIKIATVSFLATLVVITAVTLVVLWLRRRAALAETIEDWELDHPHRFPYRELYKATKGFRDSELLGAGGFGLVYKGVLTRTGDEVAVKRISSNARQGMREFAAEVASLGRMRHRHLVELRGWCKRNQDLLLVYDFMQNGSLDTHLFGRVGSRKPLPPLSWEQRFRIVKGVASGLVYLHEEWEQVVVHRDVKASNVLLGADMAARLGDFGLARLYEHGADPTTTRVVGTLGYMAPELAFSGRATTASDVFAFGALLLEVACGRRPKEPNGPGEDVHLVAWVRDYGFKGQLVQAVDPRLEGIYDKEEVELVLKLGLICSQTGPEARPSMRQVSQYLNGEEYLPESLELVFSVDTDLVDFFGSKVSITWSSCGTISTTSIQGGR